MENTQKPIRLFKSVDLNVMYLKPLKSTIVLSVVVFHLFNMVQPFESSYQEKEFFCKRNWALHLF